MKIPRSELPVITAAVNAAPAKMVPDQPSGPGSSAAVPTGPRQSPVQGPTAAAPGGAGTRPPGDEVAGVPARADIGNWPDPM